MLNPGQHVAVIDFGKTNVKLAVVDLQTRREVDERRMPNEVQRTGPYPHYDTARHWEFLLDALADVSRHWDIGAISVTTHGATAALVDADGELVLPILDYEHPLPDDGYDAMRPDFAVTGSPRLGMGLNLGAQLHWQFGSFPEAARTARILTYPQYWAYRLTGVLASEVTSLGCHTDLWSPWAGDFSPLVDRMGWRGLMPPLRAAGEVLGPILPQVAARTGLSRDLPVLCGIHDSNASLYAHLARREGAFSVVSTGTWVVSLAVGGRPGVLDPTRDVLVNVSALGQPVPSARFMGGREYELVRRGREFHPTAQDRAAVLARGLMLLPAVEPGSGPYRGRQSAWVGRAETEDEEAVALAFYLALMTAECLDMLSADGPVIVEGPFAANADYLDMLAAATGRVTLSSDDGATGTAVGAALLAGAATPPVGGTHTPQRDTAGLDQYVREWRSHASCDASAR